jgi:hypothetical protein
MNLGLRDAVSLGPAIAAALTVGTPMALRRQHQRAVKVIGIGITKFMPGAVHTAPTI